MSDAALAQALARLEAAGIGLAARVPVPWGVAPLTLAPGDVPAFLADPEGFAAGRLGGTVEAWRAWRDAAGQPRCGARDADGARCRRVIGPLAREIGAWLAEDGKPCAEHGGPGWTPDPVPWRYLVDLTWEAPETGGGT